MRYMKKLVSEVTNAKKISTQKATLV